MKETTRQKRHDERLAQLLGIPLEAVQAQREAEEQNDKSREAQAVHLFLERPDAFITKVCKKCGGTFLTTYQFVAYCSNRCRIKSLADIGIDWNPYHTPEERWQRTKIPVEYTIPPAALQVLLKIAEDSTLHNKPINNEASQTLSTPEQTHYSPGQSYNGPHIARVFVPHELDLAEE